MKCLGVDFGSKRIGLAVSDGEGRMAFPLATIDGTGGTAATVERVHDWILKERAELVVVGLPVNMNGEHGSAARKVEAFVDRLAKRLVIPVRTFDERFSTQQAERVLLQADVSRQRRKQVVDRMAAALILQGYLDSQPALASAPGNAGG